MKKALLLLTVAMLALACNSPSEMAEDKRKALRLVVIKQINDADINEDGTTDIGNGSGTGDVEGTPIDPNGPDDPNDPFDLLEIGNKDFQIEAGSDGLNLTYSYGSNAGSNPVSSYIDMIARYKDSNGTVLNRIEIDHTGQWQYWNNDASGSPSSEGHHGYYRRQYAISSLGGYEHNGNISEASVEATYTASDNTSIVYVFKGSHNGYAWFPMELMGKTAYNESGNIIAKIGDDDPLSSY